VANPKTRNLLGQAITLHKAGQMAKAQAMYLTVLRSDPKAAAALDGLGDIAFKQRQLAKAGQFFQRALAADPSRPTARLNLALVLLDQHDLEGARLHLLEAVRRDPDSAAAHRLLGWLYTLGRKPDLAARHYADAHRLDPADVKNLLSLIAARTAVCDWTNFEADQALLLARIRSGEPIQPFDVLTTSAGLEDQLHAARIWARPFIQPQPVSRAGARASDGRIRLGYLSADYHDHATAYLIAEMIETHDRARFEVSLLSYGHRSTSRMRQRLMAGCDRFEDLSALSDRDAAKAIADLGIDILIDLKGYTQGARTGIAGWRPAPIQVNYLGFPGTMGAPFIDYVLVDRQVCPFDFQSASDEKIVHLPGCFQPNDRSRTISDTPVTRSGAGLPEEAFVFCSFANAYKITPSIFALWMRVLKAVPGSVLWLYAITDAARANLARHAENHELAQGRLVFADYAASADHLARLRLADLCLDTLPVSAFTTASDAMWAGVPLLTCTGATAAGRGSTSLLTAMGVPELITGSLVEYEASAVSLAESPGELAALRKRIDANRLTSPLFDSAQHTRDLERAYEIMWRRHQSGQPPEPFTVPAAT
jgi:protein O-GlcNAc transferase